MRMPALGLFLQLRKRLLRATLFTAVMSSMDQVVMSGRSSLPDLSWSPVL